MTPEEFVAAWERYLTRTGFAAEDYFLERLSAIDPRLSATTARFLAEAGLPEAAGLTWRFAKSGLKRVPEVYNRGCDWGEDDLKRLESYLMLGSGGGGNPVCLDTANQERIVFLNHERNFSMAEFVNSGIPQLAQCMLAYQELVEEFQHEHGDGEEGELYEGNVPESQVLKTIDRFRSIDLACVEGHCYWPRTLDYI